MLIGHMCHLFVPPLVPLGGSDTVSYLILPLARSRPLNMAPSDPPLHVGCILGTFVLLGGDDPPRSSAQSSSGD